MAAADGYRLAVQKGPLETAVPEEFSINLPANFLKEMNRIKGKSEEPVHICLPNNRKQAMFEIIAGSHGDFRVEMTTQLLEGDYPEYEDLIPTNNEVQAVFDGSLFPPGSPEHRGLLQVQLQQDHPGPAAWGERRKTHHHHLRLQRGDRRQPVNHGTRRPHRRGQRHLLQPPVHARAARRNRQEQDPHGNQQQPLSRSLPDRRTRGVHPRRHANNAHLTGRTDQKW